jgi:hypothetical protein
MVLLWVLCDEEASKAQKTIILHLSMMVRDEKLDQYTIFQTQIEL